jgi:hypothetical protein
VRYAQLNCLVLVDPNWAILPVRFRQVKPVGFREAKPARSRKAKEEPYTIAVTPLHTRQAQWYTLADVLASIVLGGPAPKIRRAIRFVPKGRHSPKSMKFRNTIWLRSNEAFFKPIVEERQVAKRGSEDDPDLGALERGLKEMAASGTYGIYAEINVSPADSDKAIPGDVYSDICFPSLKVHDERPGAFSNPVIASLITGGARLMLAMLEAEVTRLGGTFIFCDTDSLAIVCGAGCPEGIPSLREGDISDIVERFDALKPLRSRESPAPLEARIPRFFRSTMLCHFGEAIRPLSLVARAPHSNRESVGKRPWCDHGSIPQRINREASTADLACDSDEASEGQSRATAPSEAIDQLRHSPETEVPDQPAVNIATT